MTTYLDTSATAQTKLGDLTAEHLHAAKGGGVNLQLYNILDYGAVMDGSTDDSAAINAAIADALRNGGGVVFVPSTAGTFCAIGSVITMKPSVTFLAQNVVFQPAGTYTGTAFQFLSGTFNAKGEKYLFGHIQNFSTGAAILMQTTSGAVAFVTVEVTDISSCYYGLACNATTDASQYVIGCTFTFKTMTNPPSGFSYGIYLNCNTNQGIQGLTVHGELIIGYYVGVMLTGNGTSQNQVFSSNVIDILGINGNVAATFGILFDNCSPSSANLFKCWNSFGAFGSGQYITNLNGASPSNQFFELAVYEFPHGSTLGGSYGDFGGLNTGSSSGNTLRVLGASQGQSGVIQPSSVLYYNATTIPNSRSTFNGGAPVFYQRFRLACTLPTLASGQSVDFYCYSPYVTGVQNSITITPNQLQAPVAIMYAEDTSTTNANEIHLRFQAFSAVASGALAFVNVIVGGN